MEFLRNIRAEVLYQQLVPLFNLLGQELPIGGEFEPPLPFQARDRSVSMFPAIFGLQPIGVCFHCCLQIQQHDDSGKHERVSAEPKNWDHLRLKDGIFVFGELAHLPDSYVLARAGT
jgi:hypothetical protein